MTMGTNHLGHFYLTYLLWEEIKAAVNPRIVNVSALMPEDKVDGMQIKFEDFNYEHDYNRIYAYARSKKANVLFSR